MARYPHSNPRQNPVFTMRVPNWSDVTPSSDICRSQSDSPTYTPSVWLYLYVFQVEVVDRTEECALFQAGGPWSSIFRRYSFFNSDDIPPRWLAKSAGPWDKCEPVDLLPVSLWLDVSRYFESIQVMWKGPTSRQVLLRLDLPAYQAVSHTFLRHAIPNASAYAVRCKEYMHGAYIDYYITVLRIQSQCNCPIRD